MNFHSTAKFYSKGDCNSYQTRREENSICVNQYALQYFSLPHPAHAIMSYGANECTGKN